jgi:hypothetical protein
MFWSGEILYLFKDTTEFKIYTWTTNEKYKYIDKDWNFISDINNNIWKTYIRTLKIERKDTIANTINNKISIHIKKVK